MNVKEHETPSSNLRSLVKFVIMYSIQVGVTFLMRNMYKRGKSIYIFF